MSKKNLLTAFIGGVAAGAMLGLWLAPQSGKETRVKIKKDKDRGSDYVDELIRDGKKSWYETKGKAEKSVGIAADEVDSFLRHVIGRGEKWWNKAKNKAYKAV